MKLEVLFIIHEAHPPQSLQVVVQVERKLNRRMLDVEHILSCDAQDVYPGSIPPTLAAENFFTLSCADAMIPRYNETTSNEDQE